MSVIFGSPTNFKALHLSILTTLYKNAGDIDEHVLSNVGLTSATYDRRNYLLTGGFKVGYPGSDYPDDVFDTIGAIELLKEDYRPVDRFTITSLENNTTCLCILPIGRRRQVQHAFIPLVKGVGLAAARGRLYVPNVSFAISDRAMPAGTPIECSAADKSIVPDADGILTAYSSIEKF
jgi:hypothetical protein